MTAPAQGVSEASVATVDDLLRAHCVHATDALEAAAAARLLALLPGWTLDDGRLCKTYRFDDYYATLAYVNALAYVTHAQDHHPELTVRYRECAVRYDTHSVNGGKGGLSLNDFICAAKADAIIQGQA